jgi:hypothetical protein
MDHLCGKAKNDNIGHRYIKEYLEEVMKV